MQSKAWILLIFLSSSSPVLAGNGLACGMNYRVLKQALLKHCSVTWLLLTGVSLSGLLARKCDVQHTDRMWEITAALPTPRSALAHPSRT